MIAASLRCGSPRQHDGWAGSFIPPRSACSRLPQAVRRARGHRHQSHNTPLRGGCQRGVGGAPESPSAPRAPRTGSAGEAAARRMLHNILGPGGGACAAATRSTLRPSSLRLRGASLRTNRPSKLRVNSGPPLQFRGVARGKRGRRGREDRGESEGGRITMRPYNSQARRLRSQGRRCAHTRGAGCAAAETELGGSRSAPTRGARPHGRDGEDGACPERSEGNARPTTGDHEGRSCIRRHDGRGGGAG